MPSTEKQDRPKNQTRSKPRQRSQLPNSVFANDEIYGEIGVEVPPFIEYGSSVSIAKTNVKVLKFWLSVQLQKYSKMCIPVVLSI